MVHIQYFRCFLETCKLFPAIWCDCMSRHILWICDLPYIRIKLFQHSLFFYEQSLSINQRQRLRTSHYCINFLFFYTIVFRSFFRSLRDFVPYTDLSYRVFLHNFPTIVQFSYCISTSMKKTFFRRIKPTCIDGMINCRVANFRL